MRATKPWIAIGLLCIAAVFLLFFWQLARHATQEREHGAHFALLAINTAQLTFAQQHKAFACDLAELRQLLPADILSGDGAYGYSLLCLGSAHTYTAVALPHGRGLKHAFCTDPTFQVRAIDFRQVLLTPHGLDKCANWEVAQ